MQFITQYCFTKFFLGDKLSAEIDFQVFNYLKAPSANKRLSIKFPTKGLFFMDE